MERVRGGRCKNSGHFRGYGLSFIEAESLASSETRKRGTGVALRDISHG